MAQAVMLGANVGTAVVTQILSFDIHWLAPGAVLTGVAIGMRRSRRSRGWSEIAIGIGLIILVSACFNYTNLSIARSLTRAKEVGIRKVAGATRMQVFGQYIMEAIIISLVAMGVALAMTVVIERLQLFGGGTDSFFAGHHRLANGAYPARL